MGRSSQDHHQSDSSRHRDSTRQLLLAMAETTWRMFAGPVVLVPAGLYSDLKFGSKPWLTILAALAGLACSIMLVRAQLRGAGQ
jgi:F0F1-type ATP synthase assembly protein I